MDYDPRKLSDEGLAEIIAAVAEDALHAYDFGTADDYERLIGEYRVLRDEMRARKP